MSTRLTLLHATSRESARAILASGFDPRAPRRSDPGDFGWGLYLTANESVARAAGPVVLRVEVVLEAPKRLQSEEFAWAWLRERAWPQCGSTVTGSALERDVAARSLRRWMLHAGTDAVIVDSERWGPAREVVVFDPTAAVVSVSHAVDVEARSTL